MKKKFLWGLGILILCIIHTFLFVTVNQNAKKLQLETDLVKIQKMTETHRKTANTYKTNTYKTIDASNIKSPDEQNFTWVRQGNHWQKVPVPNLSDR